MILLALSAVPVLMGLAILVWQSRSKVSAAPLILSMMPIALVLLVAPVPWVALKTIREFQSIAVTGSSGQGDAPRFALGMMTPVWLGNAAFLITMWIAAAVQLFSAQADAVAPDAEAPAVSLRSRIGTGMLVTASLLAFPAGILARITTNIAAILVEAGQQLDPAHAAPKLIAGMELSELSAFLANRLLITTLGGSLLLIVVLVAGVLNLLVARYASRSAGLRLYSWVLLAIVSAVALWNVIDMTSAIRQYQTVR